MPTFLKSPGLLPATAQLTPRERRALLEEIGHVALTLGRALNSPDDSSGHRFLIPAAPVPLRRPDAFCSPLERLHYLLTVWTRLEGVLMNLLRQPDSRLAATARTVTLARASGDHDVADFVACTPRAAGAWKWLQETRLAIPPSLSPIDPMALATEKSLENPPDDSRPILDSPDPPSSPARQKNVVTRPEQTPVTTRAIRSTCDTWPNRLVVTLLTSIAQEARTLGRLAAFCDAQTEALQADRLATAAQRLRAHAALRHCPCFTDREKRQSLVGDYLPRCAPAYRVAYQIWRSLFYPLDFDWSHCPFLTLPALEPWHLYEIWCFLQVSAALLQAGWQLLDGGEMLRPTPCGLRLAPATGLASRLRFQQAGCSLSLYYQPLFVSANRGLRGGAVEKAQEGEPIEATGKRNAANELAFRSQSHAMQPDMALAVNGRLILLDPKFKRYALMEEALEDIDKMHAYRDAIVPAIRDDGLCPSGRVSAVSAAWCLFPGRGSQEEMTPAGEYSQGREAMDTRRDETGIQAETFVYAYPAVSLEYPYGTAGIGAYRLRPGQPDTTDRLAAFLTALLQNISD